MINRNTTIPTKKSSTFSTAADGQTAVDIKVFQGERELVRDNKMLGNFQLVGIPPAPKGIPQIEVTFDINADGIVDVSAKDKATVGRLIFLICLSMRLISCDWCPQNKEQSIVIAASSGLSDAEIERMMAEAERFAESDKERKAVIEASNHADGHCAETDKALKEFGEKVPAEEKAEVEKLLAELRELAVKGQSGDESVKADQIKEATDKMLQKSMGLFAKVRTVTAPAPWRQGSDLAVSGQVYEARNKAAAEEPSSSGTPPPEGEPKKE